MLDANRGTTIVASTVVARQYVFYVYVFLANSLF